MRGMCIREQATLDWLSRHPSVHWIAPFTDARLHNWQGTAITQCATAAPNAPVALTQDQGTHPIWEAGLTGEGEIIGAGDSGMGTMINNNQKLNTSISYTMMLMMLSIICDEDQAG